MKIINGFNTNILSSWKKLISTGFFHIVGSGTLVNIVGFLSNIILVHIVSKGEYGLFTYAANIYGMIMIVSGLGASSTMLQFASEKFNDQEKKEAIYQYALRFGLLANCGLAALVVLAGFIYPFEIAGAQILIYMYAILPIFQYLNEYQTVYMRSERNNKGYSYINLLYSIILMLASIVGAVLLGAMGFVVAQYITTIFIVIFALKRYKVPFLIKGKEEMTKEEKWAFTKYSIVIAVGNAFSQIKTLATAFLLGLLLPSAELLASYNVALRIPTALFFLPAAVCVYLYPYFAEHINDGSWCLKYFKKAMCGIFTLNLVISIILFVLAEPLVMVGFGEQYRDAVSAFRILVINYLIAGTFNTLPGNLLGAQRKYVYNLTVNIATGFFSMLACIFFIPILGPNGAALSVLVSSIFSGIMYTTYLIVVYKRKK